MGGKTWQTDEETFFWTVIVPQSPEGVDPSQRKWTWKQCAEVMHQRLGHLRHRDYNKQLLYEHFYQNCRSERPSPRAKVFVKEYLRQRGPVPIERQGPSRQGPTRPTARSRHAATSPGGSTSASVSQTPLARLASPIGLPGLDEPSIGFPHYQSVPQTFAPVAPMDNSHPYFTSWNNGVSAGRTHLPTAPMMHNPGAEQLYTRPPPPDQPPYKSSSPPKIVPFFPENTRDPGQHYPRAATRFDQLRPSAPMDSYAVTQPPEIRQGSSNAPTRSHGSLFEALLQATCASSTDPSPHSTSGSRSSSLSSNDTSFGENGESDGHIMGQFKTPRL